LIKDGEIFVETIMTKRWLNNYEGEGLHFDG